MLFSNFDEKGIKEYYVLNNHAYLMKCFTYGGFEDFRYLYYPSNHALHIHVHGP
jgi:hypothetical protein